MKIGSLDPDVWQFPDSYLHPIADVKDQIRNEFRKALTMIEDCGGMILHNVNLTQVPELKLEGETATNIVQRYEYESNIQDYLSSLEESPVHNLQELIDWNEAHPGLELPKEYPNQQRLLNALRKRPSREVYERAKFFMQTETRSSETGIDIVLQKNGLDVLVMPMDSQICTIASASGM